MTWINKIKIKHLLTDETDYQSTTRIMTKIADIIDSSPCFIGFSTKLFRNIPKGDNVFNHLDYAERAMNQLYDFADENRIWIE